MNEEKEFDEVQNPELLKALAQVEGELKELESDSKKLEIIPWTAYRQIPRPQAKWRIKDLVPYSGIMTLVAPSSQKKTWLALEMTRAISSGESFLNNPEFAVIKSNVLYIENEGAPGLIQERGDLLNFGETNEGIFFPTQNSNVLFKDDKAIQNLLAICKQYDIQVIFFDTFSSTTDAVDSNSTDDIAKHYRKLRPLVNDGISIVIIDHCRKTNTGYGRKNPNLYDVLGSQYKVGAVDVVLMVSSEQGSNVIEVYPMKSRLSTERKPFKVIMDNVGTTDDYKVVMKYEGEIHEKEIQQNKAKTLILERLSLEDEAQTTKELITALKLQVGKTSIENALLAMRVDPTIKVVKKGNTYNYSLVKEVS